MEIRDERNREICGFICKSNQEQFVYCCYRCESEFLTGPEWEMHSYTHGIESKRESSQSEKVPDVQNKNGSSMPFEVAQIKSEIAEGDEDEIQIMDIEPDFEPDVEQPSGSLYVGNDTPTLRPLKKSHKPMEATGQTEYSLSSHQVQIHSYKNRTYTYAKTHTCDYCPAMFAFKSQKQKHMRIHTGDRPYQCTICSSSFSRSDYMSYHMRIHNVEKNFKCEFCVQSYITRAIKDKHIRKVHADGQPFDCSICDLKFCIRFDLKNHMLKTHAEQRDVDLDQRFHCELCPDIFEENDKYKAHIHWHINRMPFKCGNCTATFRTAAQLSEHMRSHPKSSILQYKCNHCKDTFLTQAGKNKHTQRVHSKLNTICNDRDLAIHKKIKHKVTRQTNSSSSINLIRNKSYKKQENPDPNFEWV